MWYSYKGADYRIGYAESADGLTWKRLDENVTFAPSPLTFDSKMQEYPVILSYQSRQFMLYNGNDYGKHGIGFAELKR